MKVVSKQRNSKMCFICGMDNPIGLKAQFYNMEDNSVMTKFKFREVDQSFPQRVHGGLISTMHDEMGLRAIWAKGSDEQYGVTMSIEVKFRKPVPYNEKLIGKGLVTKESAKFVTIDTEIFDIRGNVLSNAQMVYLKATPEQIATGVDVHEEMCYLIDDDVREINFIK